MSFLRDLYADLVSKRLWPIAVLLVGALVAVPVVLSKPAPDNEQATAEAQSTQQQAERDAAASEPVVSLAPATVTTKAHVKGLHAHDPFKQLASAKKAETGGGSTPAGGGGSSSSGGTGGSGQTDTTGGTGAPSEPPKTYTTYQVDLRFGEAGAQKTHHNIPRLTALPNSTDPVLVFMGVLSDGKTAVFLVSDAATPQGDATCKPKKSECTYVYLHEDDTEFFDVSAGTAGVVQYELKVLDITAKKTTSKSLAARSFARESMAGREILRSAAPSLGYLHYSRGTGTLERPDSSDADGSTG